MYRMQQQLDTCDVWPKGQIPADFHEPVVSDVPVLVLSGALDPVTPPAYGDVVARTLSRSLHAVFAFRGHEPFGDHEALSCAMGMMTGFLESSSLDGLDIRCAAELEPLPDPLTSTASGEAERN